MPKQELTKTITVSLSEKLQHESYGGAKYTSSDFFEAESETVPSTYDFDQCQEVWSELRKRVEARIAIRKQALIDSLQNIVRPSRSDLYGEVASQTPPAQESHPRTQEGAKTLHGANNRPTIEAGDTVELRPNCITPKCRNKFYKLVTIDGKGPDPVCYQCLKAYQAGAVPATPKTPVEDGPDGTPFK